MREFKGKEKEKMVWFGIEQKKKNTKSGYIGKGNQDSGAAYGKWR